MNHGTITLRSGAWVWSYERGTTIVLRHLERSGDEMQLFCPSGELTDSMAVRLVLDPNVRIWTDEDGIQWRISTAYVPAGRFAPELPDFPDQPDQFTLEFDGGAECRRVEVPITLDLGDLRNEELQQLLRQAERQRQ